MRPHTSEGTRKVSRGQVLAIGRHPPQRGTMLLRRLSGPSRERLHMDRRSGGIGDPLDVLEHPLAPFTHPATRRLGMQVKIASEVARMHARTVQEQAGDEGLHPTPRGSGARGRALHARPGFRGVAPPPPTPPPRHAQGGLAPQCAMEGVVLRSGAPADNPHAEVESLRACRALREHERSSASRNEGTAFAADQGRSVAPRHTRAPKERPTLGGKGLNLLTNRRTVQPLDSANVVAMAARVARREGNADIFEAAGRSDIGLWHWSVAGTLGGEAKRWCSTYSQLCSRTHTHTHTNTPPGRPAARPHASMESSPNDSGELGQRSDMEIAVALLLLLL